jgi:hypothetical protein
LASVPFGFVLVRVRVRDNIPIFLKTDHGHVSPSLPPRRASV